MAKCRATTGSFFGARAEIRLSYDHLGIGFDVVVGRAGGRDGLGHGGELGFDLPLGDSMLGGYAGIDGSTIRLR